MPSNSPQGGVVREPPGRLLVVDDEPAMRAVIRESMLREGYEVVEAANGWEAFEKLADQSFDVVIIDLEMPGMGGIDVLYRMKHDKSLRDIPVIIVSGLYDTGQVIEGIRAGAADHLGKPFNPLLLRTRVDACVERKRWRDRERSYLETIKTERERADRLLLNILPDPIAERLKQGEAPIADTFDNVTVLFADIVGFTSLSSIISPEEIVRILNEIFTAFDDLATRHGLEKIKTIGDCYMAVAGLPEPRGDHAAAAARMALEQMAQIDRINSDFRTSLRMRIGLNSGLVVAGVIGRKKFIYDLWGDTVNVASRMESHGEPGRIHMSEATRATLGPAFKSVPRGVVDIKGKGPMSTWWLTGVND